MQELNRRVDRVRIRVQNRFRKTINTLKPKENNKTITPEEIVELEEASRYYYVLKKFNWLLFSTNKKILDVNVDRKFNSTLNRYLNYSAILDFMLAIDDELEDAFYLRNDVTYFYDHCTYDTAKKQLEKIIIDFRSSPIAEMSPFANTLTNWKREIINSFII
ncbi:MAG: transposase, partial [Catenibacterium mitsuokai]